MVEQVYRVRLNDETRYKGRLDDIMPLVVEQHGHHDHAKVTGGGFKARGSLWQVCVALVKQHLLAPDGVDGWLYDLIVAGKIIPDPLTIKLARGWVQANGAAEEQNKFEELVSKWK